MMRMDKRLQQIAKPERNEAQKEATKQRLLLKQRKTLKRELIMRQFLMVSIVAIALFFIYTFDRPMREQQAYTPFTVDSDIEMMYMLNNIVPNRNPNIAYPFYIERRIIESSNRFPALQQLLLQAREQATPYEGEIESEYHASELLINYMNGEQRQLKLVSGGVLYDATAQLKYELSKEEYILLGRVMILAEKDAQTNKQVYWAFFVLVSCIIGYFIIIERRYVIVSKAEAKALRKNMGIYNLFVTLLTIFPVTFMKFFIGATNSIIVLLCLVLGAILSQYVEVKRGIKRPHIVMPIFLLLMVGVIILFLLK